jgi:hypothetical protein
MVNNAESSITYSLGRTSRIDTYFPFVPSNFSMK